MSGGYLMRYHILGYNVYLFYLAIFLFTCFLFSNAFIAAEKWAGVNNLKNKELDLNNPDLDKLEVRTTRFVVRVKALTPEIKSVWTIVWIILGYCLISLPSPPPLPDVENINFDLIKSLLEKREEINKEIKELTTLTKDLTECGITDDCMKIDTIERIKEIDKQKADLVKSNCNLNKEIVDIFKSNHIKISIIFYTVCALYLLFS